MNDDNRRHIQHVWYEVFVMKVTVWPLVQHVTVDCQLCFRGLPAIFQEWWKLMRTRLSGTQWKVLVYGIAISWGEYNYYQERVGADVCDHVLDVELRVLFDMLEDKGMDSFALVGLVVVYGVPADQKLEEQHFLLNSSFKPWRLCMGGSKREEKIVRKGRHGCKCVAYKRKCDTGLWYGFRFVISSEQVLYTKRFSVSCKCFLFGFHCFLVDVSLVVYTQCFVIEVWRCIIEYRFWGRLNNGI